MSEITGSGSDRHTASAFDHDLGELRGLIAEMGGLAEIALDNARIAVVQRDSKLAARVVEDDRHIDALEARIGQHIIGLIVRRAPMADDLREVLAAHRIAGIIERVGDYSKTIAKRVPLLGSVPVAEPMQMLLDLLGGVREMLKSALNAFAARDPAMAQAVCRRDRDIDELYNRLFLALLAYMMNEPANISATAHLMFIAKSLERVGDQATNLAELVYFTASGEQLPDRHGSNPVVSS
jgi:phosphate transport system protein